MLLSEKVSKTCFRQCVQYTLRFRSLLEAYASSCVVSVLTLCGNYAAREEYMFMYAGLSCS